MRENHSQGDWNLRMMRISNLETNEIAHIIVQREDALVHQLEERGSCKRLGDGGNTHDIIIGQRSFCLQILVSERLIVHYFTIFHHSSRDTNSLKLIHHIVDGLVSHLFARRGTRHEHHQRSNNQQDKFRITHVSFIFKINSPQN